MLSFIQPIVGAGVYIQFTPWDRSSLVLGRISDTFDLWLHALSDKCQQIPMTQFISCTCLCSPQVTAGIILCCTSVCTNLKQGDRVMRQSCEGKQAASVESMGGPENLTQGALSRWLLIDVSQPRGILLFLTVAPAVGHAHRLVRRHSSRRPWLWLGGTAVCTNEAIATQTRLEHHSGSTRPRDT